VTDVMTAERLQALAREFLAEHDPAGDPVTFLRDRFDAGLAWVHYPVGLGGQGAPRVLQAAVDAVFEAAGAPANDPKRHGIGLGMAAPTLLRHGSDEQRQRFLRPLWTGEQLWCQLFSEPGAGSDLASLSTRAVRDGADWVVNGQKVWTSRAHEAQWAILLTRTDPDVPKHHGLTYFVCDMNAPGVEVRPLRQITGDAEFNEVFLTDVRLRDDLRVGAVGEGWLVARTTLMSERVAIGGNPLPRGGGMIAPVARAWRERPEARTAGMYDALLRLWVQAEAARLTGARLRQSLAAGSPGPEGSAAKLSFAGLAQQLSGLEVELLGEDGLRADGNPSPDAEAAGLMGRTASYRYLRAKGNSIEGGTSEILRGIIAERVLGLPPEARADRGPWKEQSR
jgi:alkylation response protein AidB-like acyl-CoA dehydrogenase